MFRLPILLTLTLSALTNLVCAAESLRPNIVYILCDDLGYGDARCLNKDGKIATPNLDSVAAQGMTFTDAHSGSSVCSPTRYGILTGRYAWRSRLQQGVLGGLSPRLIEPERMTVASFLKQHGYHTACIGKWHLGMDWVRREGKSITDLNIEAADQVWNVDYAKPIANGPNSVGFDFYYGISASLDMVPYTFIENDHVVVLPTEERAFPMMRGREGGMTRTGPAAPQFDATDVLPTLTRQAVAYIGNRAKAARKTPFFLYLPLASPHTPIMPAAGWEGKSGLNPYADFVMQTDAAIGEVLQALEDHQLSQETLVIVTSDNGCSPQAKFNDLLPRGHNPNYVFRGNKADIYEGGHRIPFFVRWPGQVQADTTSQQLLCLTDLLATCAEILGERLPADAGEDSASFLAELRGQADGPRRESIVHHSINGSFAIRQGPWKLALCPGSGGWSEPRPNLDDTSQLPLVQLFHLGNDLGERQNVESQHPEEVKRLTDLLERFVREGRSTPGTAQQNTVTVDIWRGGREAHQPLEKKKARKKAKM